MDIKTLRAEENSITDESQRIRQEAFQHENWPITDDENRRIRQEAFHHTGELEAAECDPCMRLSV